MDALAVVLVALALVSEGVATVGGVRIDPFRLHLVAAGLTFFFGALLAAGGLHISIGT